MSEIEKRNEDLNGDLKRSKRGGEVVNLVEAFNEALKEHPLRRAGLLKRKINQIEHSLQKNGLCCLIFRFNADEKKIKQKFYGGFKHAGEEGKIYYLDANILIGGKEVRWYLCFDERTHIFEMGARGYPESQDARVIEMMREDLKEIES